MTIIYSILHACIILYIWLVVIMKLILHADMLTAGISKKKKHVALDKTDVEVPTTNPTNGVWMPECMHACM